MILPHIRFTYCRDVSFPSLTLFIIMWWWIALFRYSVAWMYLSSRPCFLYSSLNFRRNVFICPLASAGVGLSPFGYVRTTCQSPGRKLALTFLMSFLAACLALASLISSLVFFLTGCRCSPFLLPLGMHFITSMVIPALYSICLYLRIWKAPCPKFNPFIKP